MPVIKARQRAPTAHALKMRVEIHLLSVLIQLTPCTKSPKSSVSLRPQIVYTQFAWSAIDREAGDVRGVGVIQSFRSPGAALGLSRWPQRAEWLVVIQYPPNLMATTVPATLDPYRIKPEDVA